MEANDERTSSESTPGDLEALASDLDALSNENRVRLLHLLTEPRYAEEIADGLGMSRQSAMKHVDKLAERGFVRQMHGRRETGPVKEYVTVPQRLFALGMEIGDLGKLQPEGGPQQRRVEATMAMGEDGAETAPRQRDEAEGPDQLLILNGPAKGEAFQLTGDGPRWTIGREEDRDLTIDHDPYVSAHHAEVHEDWRGLVLVDAFSSNGTKLNFKRVPEGGRIPLTPGDVIEVGHTLLVHQRGEPSQGT